MVAVIVTVSVTVIMIVIGILMVGDVLVLLRHRCDVMRVKRLGTSRMLALAVPRISHLVVHSYITFLRLMMLLILLLLRWKEERQRQEELVCRRHFRN